MSLLTLPRAQIPLVDANGQVNREWYRYFNDLTKRAGGVDGSSSEDLTLSQFEDAADRIKSHAVASVRNNAVVLVLDFR